jgi:predicted RNA-binding Zn ribbon-like protein
MVEPMPTPTDIELVRSFVNTMDVEDATDALTTPAELRGWLRAHGQIARGTTPSTDDLDLARRLRGALRAELAAHHDGDVDPVAVAELDAVCAELPLRAVASGAALAPCGTDARAGLAAIVAAAARGRITGTWSRLKICPADDCQWAFYDASRNRSRRWCSMDVCGNRSKVRAFRDRTTGH